MPNQLYLDDAGVATLKTLIGQPTDEQVTTAVHNELVAHPEWTTTVQDGSITGVKIADDTIPDAKLAQTGGVLSEVTTLKSDMGLLVTQSEIIGTPKNGYWRNGSFTDGTSAYTKEFDVSGLSFVTLTEYANLYRDAYVFLDSSNNVLSSALGTGDHSASGNTMVLTVPNGAKYLDSSTSSGSNVANIRLTAAAPNVSTGDIAELQSQIYDLGGMEYSVLNGNNANVFYRGAELKTGYSSAYSRKFRAVAGRKYRISLTTGANFNAYTFVDANGTVLSYVLADSATSAEYYVTAPSGAVMLYCSTNSSTVTSISVYQQVSETEFIDGITKKKYLAYIWHDCICIGDSLTQGYRNNTLHSIEDYSYPTFLSRMAGWEVVNAGWSGITPLGWWDKRTLYTYSDKQLAIIKLGQNEGLTDTLEEDTDAESYEDYADTNTGAYCKIIEYIKEQNPHIVIFVVSIRAYRDSVTNDVLQQIADKYSLPFIDLNDSRFNLEANDIHTIGGVYDAVHFNTLGYSQLAASVYELIVSALANDKSIIANYGEW